MNMKKGVLVIALALVITSLLVSCSGDKVKTWEVIKSTGLYDRADVDAEMLESLSVGTKVKDINEKDYFSTCETTEGIRVCLVTVAATGQEGWVIIKWLD